MDLTHKKPRETRGAARCAAGLPETVHVDALGRLVLPLAVLLEPDLLVHAQPVGCRSGLHEWPGTREDRQPHRAVTH